MRILKVAGAILVAFVVLAGLVYLLRSDPIGPIAGRAVTGEAAPYPDDWAFTDAFTTIAVEVRPDDPHSVTTICFVHDGDLYVPSVSGSTKDWPRYVLEDPRVRLKIGDAVYPALAYRVTDADTEAVRASAALKYPQLLEAEEPPRDVWLFRIAPRE